MRVIEEQLKMSTELIGYINQERTCNPIQEVFQMENGVRFWDEKGFMTGNREHLRWSGKLVHQIC